VSSDLGDLYQELILDHKRHPRNFHRLDDATHLAQGHNPLCGDELTLYLKVEDGRILDIGFEGQGCAISTASASLLTETLKGKTVSEAEALFGQMHDLLTRDDAGIEPETLGRLGVLAGVRDYPTRVKCATLAWHTLTAALAREQGPATTE
jgi:nitrogen fixation NifU-like protein